MNTLNLHSEPLRAEWLDAYGHLNEAHYLTPFANASWKMQDYFDIGVAYFERSGAALYTLEAHIRYVAEVRAPAQLEIETIILGADAKRIWFAHLMMVDSRLRATCEYIGLHYDTRQQCAAPLPAETLRALLAARVATPPDWVGRSVSMTRRK